LVSFNFSGSYRSAVESANYPNFEADIKDETDCAEKLPKLASVNLTEISLECELILEHANTTFTLCSKVT